MESFTAHRVDFRCVNPSEVVGKRKDTPRTRLVPKTTDGICALGGGTEAHGVTVWQVEADRDKGRRFV